MPRGKRKPKSADQEMVRRELWIITREMDNVIKIQWKYARQILMFGLGAWVIGVATWVAGLIAYNQAAVSGNPLIIASTIFAAVVPAVIITIVLRGFSAKLKRFERVRRTLLTDYEKMLIGQIKRERSEPESILPR